MSLNQLLNPSGDGLDIKVGNIISLSSTPNTIGNGGSYTFSEDELVKQKTMILIQSTGAIILNLPSTVILERLLPNVGDSLEINFKYRSASEMKVQTLNGLSCLMGGLYYNIQPTASGTYASVVIGVGKFYGGIIAFY